MRSLCIASIVMLSGCMGNPQKIASMNQMLMTGHLAEAAQIAEQQDKGETEVLSSLNKGMLRRMTAKYSASNAIFEKAKRQIDDQYGVSVTDQLGAVTINDTLRDYSGDRYEQVLLHAFMAMNYIDMGLPDSARVEMLQADVKMREWGDQPEEDPFIRYLSGIIYELLGEPDEAIVSYRKAVQVYRETQDKQATAIPLQLKTDLLNLLYNNGRDQEYQQLKREFKMSSFKPAGKGDSSVIVILNHGAAPHRSEHAIQTLATEVDHIVRIALPRYKHGPRQLNTPVVSVSGREKGFEKVEDVDALARWSLDDDMAIITTRAIARAVIKHKAHQKAKEKDPLAGFLTKITNLATERADTRSWTTLPQQIELARVPVPAGQQEVVIKMKNAAGFTIDKIKRNVKVPRGGVAVVSAHWVAPIIKNIPANATKTAQAK